MSSLQRIAPAVQSDRPVLRSIDPVEDLDGIEPADHSFRDEVWWAGYTAGRESSHMAWAYHGDRDLDFAFVVGRCSGTRDRECREAYELGREMGVISEISEPPAGLKSHEAAEYRRGFADGQAELRRAEEEEARDWMERIGEERDRMEAAFGREITDADIYPAGCWS